jgi:hypothetical protein
MRFPIHKVSHSNGEISPIAYARIDTEAFSQSVGHLQNLRPTKEGPIRTRNSLRYVKPSTNGAFLVPFKLGRTSSFMLEIRDAGSTAVQGFTRQGLRKFELPITITSFVVNGGMLFPLATRINFTGILPPGTVIVNESVIHGYDSTGTKLWSATLIDDFLGLVISIDFTVFQAAGYDVNTETIGLESSGQLALSPTETVHGAPDIKKIHYAQTKNALYLVEKNMQPRKITLSRDNYTLLVDKVLFTVSLENRLINGPAQLEDRPGNPNFGNPVNPNSFFPNTITFYEQRLVLGSESEAYFSRLNSFEDFTLGPLDSDSIATRPASREGFDVLWIEGAEKFLLIGTTSGEFVCTPSSEYGSITQFNINFKPMNRIGSEPIQAQNADGRIYYVERGARKIAYVTWAAELRSYRTVNSTEAKEHVTVGEVERFGYVREPYTSEVYSLKKNGEAIVQVINDQRAYEGFYRITLREGDSIEDLCAGYDELGRDTLFVICRHKDTYSVEALDHDLEYLTLKDFYTGNKTEDEENFRVYREYTNYRDVRLDNVVSVEEPIPLDLFYELRSGDHYFFVKTPNYFTDLDAIETLIGRYLKIYGFPQKYEILGISEGMGNSYLRVNVSEGIPTKTEYGPYGCFGVESAILQFPFLEPDPFVDIVVDGVYKNVQAIGGIITLEEPAKIIHYGYKFFSYSEYIIGFSSDRATSLLSKTSISEVGLSLLESGPFKYGNNLYNLAISPNQIKNINEPPLYYNGDKFCSFKGDGMKDNNLFYIVTDTPFPIFIRNIAPLIEVAQR